LSASDLTWIRVARTEDIPLRGARVVRLGDRDIAVFRTSADRVFALLDRCPHRGGPLSQGIVHGDCVTCPLHDWVIRLETGEARAPDEGRTERFPVQIENGEVLLGLPEGRAAADGPAASGRSSAALECTAIAGPAAALQ
jgi:nitrite reductase (NADH) small subunit